MSINGLSAMLQKHIVDKLQVTVEKASVKGNKALRVQSINADVVRDELEKARQGHTSAITRQSLQKLKDGFKNTETEFTKTQSGKYTDTRGTLDEDFVKALDLALEQLDYDQLVEYIVGTSGNKRNLKAPAEKAIVNGRKEFETVFESRTLAEESGVSAKGKIYSFPEDKQMDTLILNNIPQEKFKKLVIDFLEFKCKKISAVGKLLPEVISFLKANLQAGHLTGVVSLRLKNLLGTNYDEKSGFNMGTGEEFSKTNNDLNAIFGMLTSADYLSSNLRSNHEIFLIAGKELFGNNPTATTELQISSINTKSGGSLNAIGSVISKIEDAYLSPQEWERRYRKKNKHGNKTSVNKEVKARYEEQQKLIERREEIIAEEMKNLFKYLKTIMESLKAQIAAINQLDSDIPKEIFDGILNTQAYMETLLNSESSPSFFKAIGMNFLNRVKTGFDLPVYKAKVGVKTSINLPQIKALQDNINNAVKNISSLKTSVSKLEAEAKKSSKQASGKNINTSRNLIIKSKLRTTQGTYTSLPKLLALINQDLQKQIKGNMGTGGQNRVLNYQTGRFSESAKVERMSQSREGMITAFYSYMKYPYATFSEGGRQQLPHSRDPKLLISKSIREIAASVVGNRLRAVLI